MAIKGTGTGKYPIFGDNGTIIQIIIAFFLITSFIHLDLREQNAHTIK